MKRPSLDPSLVRVRADRLEELDRIARSADKLAGDVERYRKLEAVARGMLFALDTDRVSSRHVEALRKALEGVER